MFEKIPWSNVYNYKNTLQLTFRVQLSRTTESLYNYHTSFYAQYDGLLIFLNNFMIALPNRVGVVGAVVKNSAF